MPVKEVAATKAVPERLRSLSQILSILPHSTQCADSVQCSEANEQASHVKCTQQPAVR